MLSIRKRDLSVLNVQKIIYIDCSYCTIKRCKNDEKYNVEMQQLNEAVQDKEVKITKQSEIDS